jgi:hypothetical protein
VSPLASFEPRLLRNIGSQIFVLGTTTIRHLSPALEIRGVTREIKRSRILVIVQDWAALFNCAFLSILHDSATSGMRTLTGFAMQGGTDNKGARWAVSTVYR